MMHVYVEYEGDLHTPPYPANDRDAICDVEPRNSSIMRCITPAITDRARIRADGNGHSNPLNATHLKFILRFTLDGVRTYENLTDALGKR